MERWIDHAEALAKIRCPALLLHAKFSFLPDGTLNGAMTQEDADKAIALLPNGTYPRVDATHVVHLDKPDLFVDVLYDFFLEAALVRRSQNLRGGLLLGRRPRSNLGTMRIGGQNS